MVLIVVIMLMSEDVNINDCDDVLWKGTLMTMKMMQSGWKWVMEWR